MFRNCVLQAKRRACTVRKVVFLHAIGDLEHDDECSP
jgi:hypothetical protein